MPNRYAAVDLGATSGRVIIGTLADGRLETELVSRFSTEPVRTPDGLHWDLLAIYRHVLDALAGVERDEPGGLTSIGVDSWAVDYGLLRGGCLLGMPYHYRDERNQRGVEAIHHRISPEELYRANGLQHLPFNTIFQLATEGDLLRVADRMLLIPDLLNYWLTGRETAERTNASTTGLLGATTHRWDLDLAARAQIPATLLPPLVEPGTRLGTLGHVAAAAVGRAVEVVTVASHDTASAIVAIPSTGDDFAYVSCGTWGLVGLELPAPILTEAARLANFTNEGGIDGTTRFLHNVMGLWLLSESIRFWRQESPREEVSLEDLLGRATLVGPDVPLFDVDDPRFMAPGDIPGRIAEWLREHGERVPRDRAETVRVIIESLAAAFARAVRNAADLAGKTVNTIHMLGGGSHNALLCQATADRSGLPVLAGPAEATAIGNILVQARAHGSVMDLRELRRVVRDSGDYVPYRPAGG